ncbi:MAG: winged helix-turn-helix transcriptional regulator [Candidatus ainarchaeum sp.]|jgi:uncharacterized membrane protein|nr:winged helix-turn-helix transcriptional regulator [Candidatus ainarchaeum sp.]
MKYYKFLSLLFIFFISFNLYAYNIEKIDTLIVIREDGVLQISDKILFTEVVKSDQIVLSIVPVYDLKIKSDYKDLNYSYSLDNLTINASDCCILDNTLSLEIIYLTDVFSYKNENVWSINYIPIFREYTDSFVLRFPKNTEINNLSVDYKFVEIVNNHFVLNINETVSKVDVSYSINRPGIEENSFNWSLFFIVFFVFFISSFLIRRYVFLKKSKSSSFKNTDNNLSKENFLSKENKEDLLLGLNENEQKIIKIILEKNGMLQKNLSKECFLPKGTVSRNLKKLESKGYIEIKRYGVNKKVFLGEVFLKK